MLCPRARSMTKRRHTEDEVYHIVRGRGMIRVDTEDHTVGPGSIVFVPAGVEHRFHSIEEAFEVLVLFAPAEGSTEAIRPQ